MPVRFDRFERVIDCSSTSGYPVESEPFEIAVGPYLKGTLQFTNITDTTWATGVLTVTASLNGKDWVALPSAVNSTSTYSANGLSTMHDLSFIMFLRVAVTTAESSLQVKVTFCGKDAG